MELKLKRVRRATKPRVVPVWYRPHRGRRLPGCIVHFASRVVIDLQLPDGTTKRVSVDPRRVVVRRPHDKEPFDGG